MIITAFVKGQGHFTALRLFNMQIKHRFLSVALIPLLCSAPPVVRARQRKIATYNAPEVFG